MSNFVLIHNHDNGVESIVTVKQFRIYENLFSENSSYKHLTDKEYKRMELTRKCRSI